MPQWSEEGFESAGVGVRVGCMLPDLMGTKLQFFGGTVSTLNHVAVSPLTHWITL